MQTPPMYESLMRAPNVGDAVWDGFERGTRMRQQREDRDRQDAARKAMAALSVNPNDTNALRTLYEADPQNGVAFEERARAATSRGAQSEILMHALTGGPVPPVMQGGMPSNALANPPQPASPALGGPAAGGYYPPANNALARDDPAPLPDSSQSTEGPTGIGTQAAPSPGPAHLQENPDPARAARERLIQADPSAYLTFEGNRLDLTEKKLKSWKSLNDGAMQLLGGVNDQASWNRARFYAAKLYRDHGEDISSLGLPNEYSPELVEELRLRGMNTAQQLQAVARENRLDWDIQDDQIDNDRADGEAASRSAYRSGSLADRQARTARPPAARGNRGGGNKGPASEGALYADIMKRWSGGAELNPREREFVQSYERRRGPKAKGGGGRGGQQREAVAVGPDGRRIVVRNGKWVDAQTGKPVQ